MLGFRVPGDFYIHDRSKITIFPGRWYFKPSFAPRVQGHHGTVSVTVPVSCVGCFFFGVVTVAHLFKYQVRDDDDDDDNDSYSQPFS